MTAALPPIPAHLPAWQAGHLAWLASKGRPTRYAVPEGTEPVRADLSGAVLRGAVLYGAVLSGAVLRGADLSGAVLTGADLSGAGLRGAVLREADLRDADLRDANLSRADLSRAVLYGANLSRAVLTGAVLRGAVLSGADLSGAVLRGADLTGATGIASIGPIGRHGRIIYAVAHDDGPMIQAGCWWGGMSETIARIEADYANDPAARDRYVAAVRAVAALVSQTAVSDG